MKYTISEFIYNVFSKLYTFFFFKKARLIRYPIFIRNRKYFTFGKNLTIGRHCRIDLFRGENTNFKLEIGENCVIGDYVHIGAYENIKIGNNVLIASKVFISDHLHGNYSNFNKEIDPPSIPPVIRAISSKKVKIGNNVWIGENVAILPGAVIGNGCTIGANTVVTKKFPDNVIIAGNPGKIIKKYDYELKVWSKVDK